MSPIVTPVTEDCDDPTVAELFNYMKTEMKVPSIPTLFLTLARAPHVYKGWSQFAWPLRSQSTSPRHLRELAVCRVLQLHNADNEFEYHATMGKKAGLSQAHIDDLANWQQSDTYSPEERAVLGMAEGVGSGPAASEESMLEMKKYFSEPEIIELTITACFYVLVSRFVLSLRIEHDDPALIQSVATNV